MASDVGVFDATLQWISLLVEAAGVSIIVCGALLALIVALRQMLAGAGAPQAYHEFRTILGRGILLGLEMLVAADIIGTVAVEPTLDNLLVLALIVVIRTVLSLSLSVEIEGRWPWQSARHSERSAHS